MHIRIGIENNIEGRTLAWALDFPGCFAYGFDETEALIRLPHSLLNYEKWIKDHTQTPWIDLQDMEMHIADRYDTFRMGKDYQPVTQGTGIEINAWFVDDWRPLVKSDLDHALKIFHWQREELLAGITTLSPETLEMQHPGERWNIWGIVKHVANAELWLLSRLNLTDLTRGDLSIDPLERLGQTASEIDSIFPTLLKRVEVLGKDGEFWSPRKIIRRTLWHQRDHIDHIKELVFM